MGIPGDMARQYLCQFNAAWDSGELEDVTQAVIDSISTMYRENPPELVYYAALYRIFSEFLEDVSVDDLAKEGTGFKESKVWNLLYDFQQDAALAIINKLQTYNGCILADSVGLGKTFTALAVVSTMSCSTATCSCSAPSASRTTGSHIKRTTSTTPSLPIACATTCSTTPTCPVTRE